jgi:hypothetical protein
MKTTSVIVVLYISTAVLAANRPSPESVDPRVERGIQISPVPIKLENVDRDKAGLGSYLVNAASGCANCHTCPTFVNTNNKGILQLAVNAQNFMAGGVPFGPASRATNVRSANVTPDPRGLPGGLTFSQFKAVLTEGHKPPQGYGQVPAPSGNVVNDAIASQLGEISVMPWRMYRNFATSDIEAIYEYLKAIPPAKPGTCTGPGQ